MPYIVNSWLKNSQKLPNILEQLKRVKLGGLLKGDPICRLCNEEDETVIHVIVENEIITQWRHNLEDPST